MKSLFFFWLKNIFHGIGGHLDAWTMPSRQCGSVFQVWIFEQAKGCFEEKQEAKGLIGQKRDVQHLQSWSPASHLEHKQKREGKG